MNSQKLTTEKVISVIKSGNTIAELGYTNQETNVSHLSCEIEIDGTEVIVEFAVPTKNLDISCDTHFDATKLTDYITEFS